MPDAPKRPRGCKLIEARYLLVTPAYLRGADQKRAELRSASFKGVLRYWWRALAWPEALAAADGQLATALESIHRQEAALFGIAAASGRASGQGVVRQLLVQVPKWTKMTGPEKDVQPLRAYMLGQGLTERDGHVDATSTAIPERTLLSVSLLVAGLPKQQLLQEQQLRQLATALQLLGSVGGIGARSRRGVGSLAIQSISVEGEKWALPENHEALREWLDSLKASCPASATPSPYTAIDESVQFVVTPGQNLSDLQDDVAGKLNQFRTYGRKEGGVRKALSGARVDGNQIFTDDHDWVQHAITGVGAVEVPRRTAFGLPHNYSFSDRRKAEIAPTGELAGIARRASPLLVHYHRFAGANSFCVVISHWPARFLPHGTSIEIKGDGEGGPRTFPPRSAAENSQVISDFLSLFTPGNN